MQTAVGTRRARSTFVAVKQGDSDDPLVLSYLGLRKIVGIIGFALPIVLILGKMLLQGGGIEDSISAYYYTDLGGWFVGSLCAIGVFLLSTRGYDVRDAIAGRLACAFAVTVAMFPTTPPASYTCTAVSASISKIHWASAALLFATLAYFCLMLFTETDKTRPRSRRKAARNLLYRVCGGLIIVSILSIGTIKFVPSIGTGLAGCSPVFWLESLAVFSFAVAWLTKGEMILKDGQA